MKFIGPRLRNPVHLDHRAESWETILPLAELCQLGMLFDVQRWIEEGKPVNPPSEDPPTRKYVHPLHAAIDQGFHSLIEVLLDAGALQEPDGWDSPMNMCLRQRRFDLVHLLIEKGFDPRAVDMEVVFDTWDPNIMEYFIERGADVETDFPLAYAFTCKIRTALRIYMKYKDRFPGFREQANIALRYHAGEGNMKWVALMLWAGADPYSIGKYSLSKEHDYDDGGASALERAALGKRYDVFRLKKIPIISDHPVLSSCLGYAAWSNGSELAALLIERGFCPDSTPDLGSGTIQSFLTHMDWSYRFFCTEQNPKRGINTDEAMDRMKSIHILVRNGARWNPSKDQIGDARRTLLKMHADYMVELIWIMSKYRGCQQSVLRDLIRTPAMQTLIWDHRPRISQLIDQMEELA